MLTLKRVDENLSAKTIDKIVELGKEFNYVLGELVNFSHWKAEELVSLAAAEDSDYFLILLLDEEKIVGLLGGILYSPLFSTTTMAAELLWYVKPEHRGSSKAIKMMKEFETWAKEQGAKYVAMVAQEDSGSDPSRIYERLGYKLAERTFRKRV